VVYRRHNPDMMVAGIVLTSLGLVMLVAGGTLIGVDQANGGNTTYDENGDPISSGFGTLGVTGIGLAAGSAVPLAIGIPLWVVGARGDAVPVAGVPRPSFAVVTRSGVQTKTASLSWSF
jgi:hypothetical protein